MERPTFYAVIPAFVRYAPISANAKLMYGEVTALCEVKGFCWASNGYFGKLYDANERTIRRWLTELVRAGFVTVDLAANQYGERRIFIADARTIVPGQICPDKNARHNDTRKENDTREHTPHPPRGSRTGLKKSGKRSGAGAPHRIHGSQHSRLTRLHSSEDLRRLKYLRGRKPVLVLRKKTRLMRPSS